MAIQLPNNKISRTLPEQVGFNSAKIEEIIKAINDFELQDKVINLGEPSGTLSDSQFATAELSPSYIVYNGKVFIKAVEDSTYIDFIEAGALVGGSTSLTLSVERIRITISSKAYQYAAVQLFESYTKAQIDSLISTSIAALQSVYAKLSGANFTGAITAPSIIENMSGYSFSKDTPTDTTITPIYSGVVKNGNKITFVYFLKIQRLSTGIGYGQVGEFFVPADVLAKLYPTQLGVLTSALASMIVNAFSDPQTTVSLKAIVLKGANNIAFYLYGMNNLTANTEYQIRFEQTFLLSDNLAQ